MLPTLLVSDPAAFDPDTLWLLASVNIDIFEPWWSVILDRQGRIVWALETDRLWSTMMPRPSHDGTTLIIDHNSYWQQFDEGENSMLRRIKIDGTVLAEQAVPGMHHAWTDMPDGSVVYGAGQPVEKLLMVAPDGAMQEIWDCADFLSSAGLEDQDCRSNFVDWRADTDTFLFSSVSLETLLVIDHASGETLRWFGDAGGPWVFDPPESQFWWQHGAHYLADGTILVSTKNEDGGNETLVRQFEEDTESQTLRQVWSFGEGEGVYTKAGGGASRLDNGNTLHHYGQTSRMREATPAGEVVWDLEWGSDDSQLGHVWPLDDLYAFVP